MPKIAVLGGGIAGLSAALELIKLGYEVELFEAKENYGGRIWTVNLSGTPVELGANWIEGLLERGDSSHDLQALGGLQCKRIDLEEILPVVRGVPLEEDEALRYLGAASQLMQLCDALPPDMPADVAFNKAWGMAKARLTANGIDASEREVVKAFYAFLRYESEAGLSLSKTRNMGHADGPARIETTLQYRSLNKGAAR